MITVPHPAAAPVPTRGPALRALPHAAGLVTTALLAIAVGRPVGWVGVGAIIGPTVVLGILVAMRRGVTADDLEGVAFATIIAAMTAGGWALTQAPAVHQSLVVVYPLALLAFLFGAFNFPLVACSRTLRAWRGDELDYPWLTDRLRGRLAAIRERNEGDSHGDR